MDTSSEYVKMCEAAVEIQRQWKPRMGDYVSDIINIEEVREIFTVIHAEKEITPQNKALVLRSHVDGICDLTNTMSCFGFIREGMVWLPRQDQLQEMIYAEQSVVKKEVMFHYWIQDTLRLPLLTVNSLEQLWLRFVTEEKFNKYWNGGSWCET